MGAIVSQLLAEALAAGRSEAESRPLCWKSRPMGARVDLADKDALYSALDDQE